MNPRDLDRVRFVVSSFLVLTSLLPAMAGANGRQPEPVRSSVDAGAPAAGPELTVAKTDLERLIGFYENKEMGFAFKLDLQGDRLRLTIKEGPQFPPALLIPASLTEFRWEGKGLAPGLHVTFQVTGDKAASLTVIHPGMPQVVMKRVSG
ncbi:MAG TPA: hypothetical protein VGM86_17625 [Thermoanaerobaculia bacterium]|jgi:hypothetical protein